MADGASFAILIVVLLFKPNGLLARSVWQRASEMEYFIYIGTLIAIYATLTIRSICWSATPA
jgi:hypothetical protein